MTKGSTVVAITLDGKTRAEVTEKAFEEVWKPRGYTLADAPRRKAPTKKEVAEDGDETPGS